MNLSQNSFRMGAWLTRFATNLTESTCSSNKILPIALLLIPFAIVWQGEGYLLSIYSAIDVAWTLLAVCHLASEHFPPVLAKPKNYNDIALRHQDEWRGSSIVWWVNSLIFLVSIPILYRVIGLHPIFYKPIYNPVLFGLVGIPNVYLVFHKFSKRAESNGTKAGNDLIPASMVGAVVCFAAPWFWNRGLSHWHDPHRTISILCLLIAGAMFAWLAIELRGKSISYRTSRFVFVSATYIYLAVTVDVGFRLLLSEAIYA